MSYDGIGTLTPTRAAPPAPKRIPTDMSSSSASTYSNSPSFTSYTSAASTSATSYHSANSGFHPTYSGVGGSPDRGPPMSPSVNGPAVRTGYVSVKEDGFASWLWGKKWLVLREEVLSIHRNEVRRFKRQNNQLFSLIFNNAVGSTI